MNPFLNFMTANKGKGSFRAEGSTLWLYDVIAGSDDEAMFYGGVSPTAFITALAATSGPVTLRINSPGGSVFGAQAMVAAMRAHGEPITARVDSLAASAASLIATEAAVLEVVPGAMIMIHKAWGMAIGNCAEMRGVADLLEKIDFTIATTYARRTGGDSADWLALMASETWFSAEEAVAAGLADAMIDDNKQRPKAMWDLTAFAKAPDQPAAEPVNEPEAKPEPEAAIAAAPETPAPDLRAMRERRLSARLAAHEI